METKELMSVKNPISAYKIRFQDCDPLGHLNNSRYLDYLLNAREDHLETYYGLSIKNFIQKGVGWVVANHEIYYLQPALFDERISIETCLINYGESDLVVEARMMNEYQSQTKSLLWTRFVHVSTLNGKKTPHHPDLLTFFEGISLELITDSKTRLQSILALEKKM